MKTDVLRDRILWKTCPGLVLPKNSRLLRLGIRIRDKPTEGVYLLVQHTSEGGDAKRVSGVATGDTHPETGGPARLPARLLGDGDP